MDKALMALAAAAAIAAAAAVSIVAAAFALYALVEPSLGPAGAGAIVAVAAALIVGGAGLIARRRAGPADGPRHHHGKPDASLVEKVMVLAKAHPMLAVAAAVAAGAYAIRNPSLMAAVLGAVMENRSRKD